MSWESVILKELELKKKNEKEAIRLFQLSAAQNYIPAIVNLGICHFKGIGTSQDYTQALPLLQKAAESFNPTAAYHIGCIYLNGLSVSRNMQLAFKWLKFAAEQQFNAVPEAQLLLASLIKSGKLAKADLIITRPLTFV